MRALAPWVAAAVEPAWAVRWLRIGIGLAALGKAKLGFGMLRALESPVVLKAPYAWSPPPPAGLALYGFLAVWVLSAVGLIAGFRVKASAWTLAASITYYLFCDQQLFANHALLVALVALLVGFVVDGQGRAVHFWPILLIRYQISIMYCSAGLAKLNDGFLSGDVLRAYMHMPRGVFQSHLDAAYPTLSWTTVVLELTLPFLLWIRRLHPTAFVLGVGMHTGIVLTMQPRPQLAIFSLAAVSSYLAFVAKARET